MTTLPDAAPPAGMTLHQLPTGTYETRAAFAFRGGSWRDVRAFAATAVLIRHPGGDLLIDAGFGSRVAEHVRAQPLLVRSPFTPGPTASEQLTAAGIDPGGLLGTVLTHAHWDHVSGLADLPAPIWITDDELRSAGRSADGRVFRAVSAGRELRRYACTGPAYLGFPASLDVHGDGSVVIVPAGGHTPGSVIVFVALPTGARYAFIGDLTWQLDAVERRLERPLAIRMLADADPARIREYLPRLAALAGVLHVVPAHDGRAYDTIPRLVPAAAAR